MIMTLYMMFVVPNPRRFIPKFLCYLCLLIFLKYIGLLLPDSMPKLNIEILSFIGIYSGGLINNSYKYQILYYWLASFFASIMYRRDEVDKKTLYREKF